MRSFFIHALTGLLFASGAARVTTAQQVVDRIAARVENDVILQSEVKELSQYQALVDGKSESDAALLDRLIDQWIVRTEAEASRFPKPSDAEIDRSMARLKRSMGSDEEFEARKKHCGLTDAEIRALVASQLYLDNYLDSRFRPSAQVDEKAIEDFYENGVVPRAKARGQTPPTLEAAREYIQEALAQKSIDEQADRWLKESRARLHVEKFAEGGTK